MCWTRPTTRRGCRHTIEYYYYCRNSSSPTNLPFVSLSPSLSLSLRVHIHSDLHPHNVADTFFLFSRNSSHPARWQRKKKNACRSGVVTARAQVRSNTELVRRAGGGRGARPTHLPPRRATRTPGETNTSARGTIGRPRSSILVPWRELWRGARIARPMSPGSSRTEAR